MVLVAVEIRKSPIAKPVRFDDALLTSVVRYGESDCVVRLFTKQSGRIAAFFKRGLKITKGNGIAQAPALAHIGFIESPNKLARLVSLDLDPKTYLAFGSPKIFGYAAYLAELVEKFLPEADPAPDVYSMIEEAFLALMERGATPVILRWFELRLLDYCGYLPEISTEACRENVVAFDPISCQFLDEKTDGSIPFSIEALKLAEVMLIAKIGAVNYDNEVLLLMIGRIFQSRLKLLGCSPLKSVLYLKQIS